MPDDTFYRDFTALIERRHWEKKSPDEIDHDIQFMVFTWLEIYMSGKRPPGPRPMREVAMSGQRPPRPRPNDPALLFGTYGLCSLREIRPRRKRTRSRATYR